MISNELAEALERVTYLRRIIIIIDPNRVIHGLIIQRTIYINFIKDCFTLLRLKICFFKKARND